MTIARKQIVDEQTPGFYHCTNRCVRRTFLCGLDEVTGFDYSHRKAWIEKRLLELSEIFSVEIFAYAVMDNHYHIVLQVDPLAPLKWSDEDVADKWLQAYGHTSSRIKNDLRATLKRQAIMADKEKLKTYRKRLGSLSWFMGRLNEPLAKQSNNEENCAGRFWEGRFHSQALLDEGAVLSCMAYVDLNPVRANLAQTLESSKHTSIKKRIKDVKKRETVHLQKQLKSDIQSLSTKMNSQALPIKLKEYIQLVEWTGQSILYPGKYNLPENLSPTFDSFNLQQTHWLQQIKDFNNNYCHVVGPVELIRNKAIQIKKRCLKGVKAARLLYRKSE
ncbi:MAG: transposase [Kangiella sp.]|nr:MAG: transposase [Kangiella sp.]